MKNYLKAGIVAVLLTVIYYSSFVWMWERWNAAETYYSHGPLVPIVSLFFVWGKRDKLKTIALKPSNWGLVLIVLGLLMHMLGVLFGIFFVSPISLIMVISGLILYFFGSAMLKEITFPIAFLFFMVPLPLVLIADMNFKLKMLATHWSVFALNKLGIHTVQQGSTIKMPNSQMVVEGQCSGLKYLISLVAFSSVFAHVINKRNIYRWIIFSVSPLIALLANSFRITLLGWVSDVYGSDAAFGWFHDFSGFLLFFAATIGLLCVSSLFPEINNEKQNS